MTWLQDALLYALLTSLHVPLIKRITTGLITDEEAADPAVKPPTGKRYAFINSVISMPLLMGLLLIDLIVHHQIHVGIVHWLWQPSPETPWMPRFPVPYMTLGLHVTWQFWVFVLAAAWIQCSGLHRAVDAYTEGELSMVAPMGSLMPIFVALFGWWFLGEHLTLRGVFGIGAIVAGCYTILVKVKRGDGLAGWFRPFRNVTTLRGLRVYLEARAIWVFFPVVLKPTLKAMHPLSVYAVSCITVGFMCFVSAPWRRKERPAINQIVQGMAAGLRRGPHWGGLWPTTRHMVRVLRRKEAPHHRQVRDGLLLAAFGVSVSILASQQGVELNSYIRANVGAVSAIFKMDVPLIVLWGWLFFQEKSPLRRIFSGLIMATGVWLLR